jgi:hypothetical protein
MSLKSRVGISRTKQNTRYTLRHRALLLTDTQASLPVKDIFSSSDPPHLECKETKILQETP